MLDKYTINSGPSSVTASIKVDENKAPTDESVRLLNEMQDKAAHNLMNKIVIEDNDVKGKIFIFKEHFTDQFVAYIQFTMNRQPYEVRAEIPSRMMSLRDAKNHLREAMRDAILDQLINNIEIDPSAR